jgi:hypothetical protein
MSVKKSKSTIIYSSPTDGLTIRSDDNFWIHTMLQEQWDELSNKFIEQNLRIGSHISYDIKTNDIILIYVKQPKKRSGFVAIVQTCSDMIENNKNIKLYTDRNINRYLIELESIVILSENMNQSEFKDIIDQFSNYFTSVSKFTSTMLKLNSACTFIKIPSSKFGIKIVERMIESRAEQNSDCATSDNEILDETAINDDCNDCNDYNDDDIDDISIGVKLKKRVKTQSKQLVNDDDSSYDDKNNNISCDYENDNTDNDQNCDRIISNVPIMMIVCDQFRKVMKRIKLAKARIQTVIDHYMYCQYCDVTNNNKSELIMTYTRIDINNIRFCQNLHDNALYAYLDNMPYPSNAKNEYIKIYFMQNDPFYTGDILIEFSTKLFQIVEITETKMATK